MLGNVTIPLILIVVGYDIQIDMRELKNSTLVMLIRLGVLISAALLLNHFIVRGLLGLGGGFQAALFAMFVLPPSFILTLFIKQENKAEFHSVDNTLTLRTIVTTIVLIIYYALNPHI